MQVCCYCLSRKVSIHSFENNNAIKMSGKKAGRREKNSGGGGGGGGGARPNKGKSAAVNVGDDDFDAILDRRAEGEGLQGGREGGG